MSARRHLQMIVSSYIVSALDNLAANRLNSAITVGQIILAVSTAREVQFSRLAEVLDPITGTCAILADGQILIAL
jgi:hypothetical protein